MRSGQLLGTGIREKVGDLTEAQLGIHSNEVTTAAKVEVIVNLKRAQINRYAVGIELIVILDCEFLIFKKKTTTVEFEGKMWADE